MGEKVIRELTRSEKSAIRKLVTSLCANYDPRYGCLPLGDECYMLLKCWTGALCRYFRDAVLPNNTVLEAALSSNAQKTAICPVCGSEFSVHGRKLYCSEQCALTAHRKQQRRHMQIKRGFGVDK